tara:strand:+ start:323 stop:520 length:198 start_codon:yes stop_codon:yes gene_type:complete
MIKLKLKIFSNQSNEIIFNDTIEFNYPNLQYRNDFEFEEYFENEILNDIFEENNINPSEVYYSIK